MDYKESFYYIQRYIDFEVVEISSESFSIFDFEKKSDFSVNFNDSITNLFDDLFSKKKEIFISSLSKLRDLLQSNAFLKINGSLKESKNHFSIPLAIIKRLHEIVHLRFHFNKNKLNEENIIQKEEITTENEEENDDEIEDYEEDFDEQNGDDLKFMALECLALLLVDDDILEYYEETPIFNDFLTYFTNSSSILAFILYCNHSSKGRMKILESNILEKLLDILESVNIKFNLLCSLCNNLLLYSFDNDDKEENCPQISNEEYFKYYELCLQFFLYISSKWEISNFNDKTLILACLNTLITKQPSFNNFQLLNDFINKIYDNSNFLNQNYIKQCLKFFINIFSLPFIKNETVSEAYQQQVYDTKIYAFDNGFFDFLFAIIENCSTQNDKNINHILKPICLLIEKTFITYTEQILDNSIWKRFVEIYDSCQYDLQVSIAIGFTFLILNEEIMDIRLFPLTDTEEVFKLICRIEPLTDSDIFLPIVNSLIKLSTFSQCHNTEVIHNFICDDSDLHDWIDNFFDETSDPSFQEDKDPDIVNTFNENVKKWLYLEN